QEATDFADRAAPLSFHGLPTTDQYLNSGVVSLANELSLRALLRAIEHDADGAIESLYVALQMQRPFEARLLGVMRFPADLAHVVERGRPSPAALIKLVDPLAAEDRDDGP